MVPFPSDPPPPPSVGFFILRDLPSEQLGPKARKGRSVARIKAPDAARADGAREPSTAARPARPFVRWHSSTAPARGLSPQMTAGSRAARIVQELAECGPGAELVHLGPMQGLGAVGLEALARAFPGTLWFDRNDAYQREPRGRDVSPIASLLFELAPDAHPYLVRLLSHPEDDVRFYATLLANDLGDRSMLEPLMDRLFDSDIATARTALQGVAAIGGEAEIESLRVRLGRQLRDGRRTEKERARAAELLAALRD